MRTLLAIGLGYSAQAVAAELAREGWRIIGTSRSRAGAQGIAAMGYEAIEFAGEATSRDLTMAIREATHILHSAPPDAEGDPLLIHHDADLISAPQLAWVGYLSTIGVYGDRRGAWVDETAEPTPSSVRSKQRYDAERAWQDLGKRRDLTVSILRLAGIYGPGRNSLERLLAGTEKRIDKPEQVFNRIHLDDIAASVIGAIGQARRADGVFNVADDEPAPPQDIVTYAAEVLGIEPPPLIPWAEADLTPMGRSFYLETKRVRNGKIKDVLGVTLKYPTYREGLRALAADLHRKNL